MNKFDIIIYGLIIIASFILGWGLRWRYDRWKRRIKWDKHFKIKK
jgi:hypothetical protein